MGARRISVIIATCGGGPHLLDMLASLGPLRDTPEFDVVIADNRGDIDPTPILRAANDWRLTIQVVDAANRAGKAHAVNVAVASTDSDTLLILDDDDTVPPGYVAAMASAVHTNGYVGARLDLADLNDPHVAARRAPVQDTALPTFGGVPYVVGAGLGVDRGLFDRLGGFDEALLTQEDVDLGIRAARAGVTPRLVTGTHVNYRYRSTPAEVFAQERAYGRGEVQVWVKHRDYLGARPAHDLAADLAAAVRSLTEPGEAGSLVRATRWGGLVGRLEGEVRRWTRYRARHGG